MNNNVDFTSPKDPESQTRVFSIAESVFAWLSLLFGYLFCRNVPVWNNPFGGLLFIVSLFAVTAVILLVAGKRIRLFAWLTAASAIIVALTLLFSGNAFIGTLSFLYSVAAYVYFVYSSTGNNIEKPLGDLFLFDFFKALFIIPFFSFITIFEAVFGKRSRGGKIVSKILIGILLAIIPTLIIRALLSFDEGFNTLMGKIFQISILDIFSHIVSLLFGIPIGMYIFGLFISSSDKKATDIPNAEMCRTISSKIKIMSSASAIVAVIPVITLYVIFFIAQWKNYFSAFAGILPDDMIYSEYARSGFFELCGVSVVNLILILLVSLFTKRKGTRAGVSVMIINITLSTMTLVLISTAMSKMILYIERFGLTPLRVYASWFIVVLAIIFILIIIRQIFHRFKIAAVTVAACLIMFATLGLSGTDSIIAEYNIDRYTDGTLETVDLEAMKDLGDSAIPSLVRYREALDPSSFEYEEITNYLTEYKSGIKTGFFGLTVPREKARKALSEAFP